MNALLYMVPVLMIGFSIYCSVKAGWWKTSKKAPPQKMWVVDPQWDFDPGTLSDHDLQKRYESWHRLRQNIMSDIVVTQDSHRPPTQSWWVDPREFDRKLSRIIYGQWSIAFLLSGLATLILFWIYL